MLLINGTVWYCFLILAYYENPLILVPFLNLHNTFKIKREYMLLSFSRKFLQSWQKACQQNNNIGKYVHNIYMITSTMCLILNGCSVFPSLKASLLDNKPNYLLGGCVIQKRNTTYLIPLQLYGCKVRSGL